MRDMKWNFTKMVQGILNGARKWWEFNKILSRNLNTVTSLEDEPTHIIDIYGRDSKMSWRMGTQHLQIK